MARFYKKFLPKFLTRRFAGLAISDRSIRFTELYRTRKGLRLKKFGERSIPSGIISEGEIKDSKKLEEILIELRKEIGTRFVRVSLPEEQVWSFSLNIPKMKRKKMCDAIKIQLEEHLPAVKDFVFDYTVSGEHGDGYEIRVHVVPRSIIESYRAVLKKSKFVPLSFEVETGALARAVAPEMSQETHMIIDVGDTKTNVSIVRGGTPLFVSTLPIGDYVLTKMIREYLGVNFEEAERVKKEHGLKRTEENKELFSFISNYFSPLCDEINKQYIRWHTSQGKEGRGVGDIKNIILCGKGSCLTGFTDHLKITLRNNVVFANIWTNIISLDESIPEMHFDDSLRFTTALGLAIGGFRK